MIYDLGFMILYLATEILNYSLVYNVVFYKKITTNRLKLFLIILTLIIFHMMVWNFFGEYNAKGISFFSMLVIPLFFLEKFEWRNILMYPFAVIGISSLQIAFSFIFAIFLNTSEHEIIEENTIAIICQSCSILFLLLLFILERKEDECNEVKISNSQYVLLYIMVFCMFILLTPLQIMSDYLDKKYINLIGFSTSMVCVLLLIVTVWQIHSSSRMNKLQQQKLLVEKQMELQKEYYIQLIKQDKKMRKFRHDFNAHMMVLNQYCNEQNNKNIKEYLDEIVKETEVDEAKVYTGNTEVDAIINSMTPNMDALGIDFHTRGCIPRNTDVSAYEMCSLVYNLLKNAVEACEKIEDINNRKIRFEVGTYNENLFMSVRNTVQSDIKTNDYNMRTTKKNKDEHGIGTNIVKDIVYKYKGRLNSACEQNWFIVEVNI